jgi:hypothetical protein
MSLVCKLSYRGLTVTCRNGRFDGLTEVESREEKSPGTRLLQYPVLDIDTGLDGHEKLNVCFMIHSSIPAVQG